MVLNGVDCIGQYHELLKDKRLGLITSISGVDAKLRPTLHKIHSCYQLTALFGPEHGVRGDQDPGVPVATSIDPYTGVPVYSLYRQESKRLTEEMLAQVDAVLYDIQDIGARYYTFIATLLYAMEDCAAAHKELIILDRVNPLGGDVVEGNKLQEAYKSFVGCYPMPIRYGLTVGEFAVMVNAEKQIGCHVTVIPCEGWHRHMLFPDTGLHWMMPSPGIPRFETALLYPGMCLFEGTNLSEGRGTTCPFEIIGAPYIRGQELADQMNAKRLPGVIFTAAYFTPTASKYRGNRCEGVHVHVVNRHSCRPVTIGMILLLTIREQYPETFSFLPPQQLGDKSFISLLMGDDLLERRDINRETLHDLFQEQSSLFAAHTKQYHLYD